MQNIPGDYHGDEDENTSDDEEYCDEWYYYMEYCFSSILYNDQGLVMNIYVDGSYCPITKKAGIGINISQDGLTSGKKFFIPICACNSLCAEFEAVKFAYTHLRFHKNECITIFTDCQVITKAFKDNRLIKGFEQLCKELFSSLKSNNIKLKWIKREKNIIADGLARQARKLWRTY